MYDWYNNNNNKEENKKSIVSSYSPNHFGPLGVFGLQLNNNNKTLFFYNFAN